MNCLAIDPGGTTGIAIIVDGNYKTCTAVTEVEVFDLVNSFEWDCVVYETFTTSGRISAAGLYTVRLIGGIKALCHYRGINICSQTPQRRLAFITKAKEKLVEDHTSHERDALAHLLAFQYYKTKKVRKV